MEDNNLEWYDGADAYFEIGLNDIPLQSKCYGTPVLPLD